MIYLSLKESILNSKFNAMLLGMHAKRTPLYYKGYRELFLNNNISISTGEDSNVVPDAVVTGFHVDIAAEAETIKLLKKKIAS